jgi:hypothetical protein
MRSLHTKAVCRGVREWIGPAIQEEVKVTGAPRGGAAKLSDAGIPEPSLVAFSAWRREQRGQEVC